MPGNDPQPTLQDLLALCEEILALVASLLAQKKAKSRTLRDNLVLSGLDPNVPGYGTVTASNPSDAAIDGWDATSCDAWANAVKDHLS